MSSHKIECSECSSNFNIKILESQVEEPLFCPACAAPIVKDTEVEDEDLWWDDGDLDDEPLY